KSAPGRTTRNKRVNMPGSAATDQTMASEQQLEQPSHPLRMALGFRLQIARNVSLRELAYQRGFQASSRVHCVRETYRHAKELTIQFLTQDDNYPFEVQ